MGDDEAGSSLHQLFHGCLDQVFRSGIHGGGRLVQDQDRIVREQGTGDGQQLFLALGDIGPFLVQFHLVAARQRADKPVCPGGLRRRDDLLIAGVQLTVTDVFHDRSLEQPGVLQNHAEAFPQFRSSEIRQRVSADPDLPAVYVIETHQQLDDRRLPRAGRPYDGDHLSGFHIQVEVLNNNLVGLIAEPDVIEADAAVNLIR